MEKLLLVVISTLLVLRPSFGFDPNRKQGINTVLDAKWSLTPFSLEISEFLSDTKSEYFWAYLEYLAEDEIVNRKMSDKQFYQNLIEFTSRYYCYFIIVRHLRHFIQITYYKTLFRCLHLYFQF